MPKGSAAIKRNDALMAGGVVVADRLLYLLFDSATALRTGRRDCGSLAVQGHCPPPMNFAGPHDLNRPLKPWTRLANSLGLKRTTQTD